MAIININDASVEGESADGKARFSVGRDQNAQKDAPPGNLSGSGSLLDPGSKKETWRS